MISQHSIMPDSKKIIDYIERWSIQEKRMKRLAIVVLGEHAAMCDNIKINIMEGLKCICSTIPACQTRYRTLTLSLYLFVSGSSPMKNDKRNLLLGGVTNSSLFALAHQV